MAAGNTYVALASTTLSSPSTSVTFSSVPQGYTDLVMVVSVRHSYGSTGDVRDTGLLFNGDSGSNYSFTWLLGNGSAAQSGRTSGTGIGIVATQSSNSDYAIGEYHIQNYSNSSTYKTVLYRSASSGAYYPAYAQVGLWRNTAAITQIAVSCSGSYTFATGSTFNLYGILAA